MAFTSSFLQVFLAIILVIGFLLIGFAIYNFEMLKSISRSKSVQITTPIVKGIIDFNTSGTYKYNTLDSSNPLDTTYRNLGNATNQAGGAEFTYNFWLYIDSSKNARIFNKEDATPEKSDGVYKTDFGLSTDQFILFMRGIPTAYTYTNLCNGPKQDVKVKCPLVKLENAGDVLTVEFNTSANPDAVVENTRDTCNDTSTDWNYMNSFKIGVKNLKATYPKQWFMVTIMIMDTYPSDPLPIRNKARCQIYINGAVQLDTYVDGKIKPNNTKQSILLQNQGNLYIGPSIEFTRPGLVPESRRTIQPGTTTGLIDKAKSLCMADLTFMNFIPTSVQISTMYTKGFTKAYAPAPSQATDTSGQVDEQKAFMSTLSTNTEPDAVSRIYTGK